MKNVLTIAGSDSCGGAGIQGDLKTFSAHGVYGMSALTAITAQNTQGVFAVENLPARMVEQQIEVLFEDIEIHAVKIGMVSETQIIKSIAKKLKHYQAKNIVVDPVMISKSGFDLLQPQAKAALIDHLIPLADLVTPNLPEAEAIVNRPIKTIDDMKAACQSICQLGAKNVLIKGGHLETSATDVLYDGQSFHLLEGTRYKTKNTHGTGCTLSSAIAANLSQKMTLLEATEKAKAYISMAIAHSFSLGQGVGPTHHFYDLYRKAGMIDADVK